MNILRGTFRVSIVAALLTAVIAGYLEWDQYATRRMEHVPLVAGYECGLGKLDEIEASHKGYGNVDLSKYGCATRPFWASLEELRVLKNGEALFDEPRFATDLVAKQSAAIFMIVNLIGLLFIVARTALRWIMRGFASG